MPKKDRIGLLFPIFPKKRHEKERTQQQLCGNEKTSNAGGKRQLGRNWLATVAVCFLLAFTGAEFVGSTDFIHQFDPAEMLPGDQVVVQQVDLSNWEMLLQWLDIDPMDGTHPMWAAANQSVAPPV